MEMKSMKLSAEDHDLMGVSDVEYKGPKYPYGLKLNLEECCLEKLGIKDLPKVGSKMIVYAIVEVTDVHQSESEGDKKRQSVGVQITDMAIAKEPKSAEKALYGE
jgi:hypothetical protein